MEKMNVGRLCCIKQRLDLLLRIDTPLQLAQWTSECFGKTNISVEEQTKYIVYYFYNTTSQFTEDMCLSTASTKNVNDSCNEPITTANMIYLGVWILLLAFIICSNLVVLLAMQKSSFKGNNTSLLLSSLAISDLLVGLFIIPIKIKFTLHNQRFCLSEIYCKLYITADNTFFTASITNLFVICIDKYIALTFPYKYPVWMSRKKTKILLMLAWFNGIVWGTLSNIKFDNIDEPASHIRGFQCSFNNNYIYTTFVTVFVFMIPATVMGRLYFKILTIAKYHARGISESIYFNSNYVKSDVEVYKTIPTGTDKNCILTKIDAKRGSIMSIQYNIHRPSKLIQIMYYRKLVLKASKTIAIVYGTFVLCWFPVMCWSLVLTFCTNCIPKKNFLWFYYMFVEIVPILNSMLNPFIYAMTNKQFRNAFKEVLHLKSLKHGIIKGCN